MNQILNFYKAYKWPIWAGVFHGTSYIPPFPPLALLFCLVPLWLYWKNHSLKQVLKGTLLCFFIGTLIGFYWIAYTAHEFGGLPWSISFLTLIVFCLLANFHFVLIGGLWKILDSKLPGKYTEWLIPVLTMCGVAYFPTLFPWNYGGPWVYASIPGVQLADTFGVLGLSHITVLINYLIYKHCMFKKPSLEERRSFLLSFLEKNFNP